MSSSPSPPSQISDLRMAPLVQLRQEVSRLRDEEKLNRMEVEELSAMQAARQRNGPVGANKIETGPTPSSRSSQPLPPPPTTPNLPASPAAPATPIASSSDLNYLAPSPDLPNRPKVNLILYNKFEGFLDWWREKDFIQPARSMCSTECIVTKSRNEMSSADLILFHVKTHSKSDFPPRTGNVKWGYVSLEQPGYAPLLDDSGYTSKFDYSLTYDLDSSIPTITVSPHFTAQQYHDAKVLSFAEKDGFGEPNAIAAFVSNCRAAGAETRLAMMEELSKYMPVHSYGSCMNNKKEPHLSDVKAENKQRVLQRYKFYLSFENKIIKDYVSEKVFDGLLGGTLPVYRGAESIDKFMPSETTPAVVKMSDFEDDMKALSQHLLKLANDETEYNKYFQWKTEASQNRFQSVLDMTAYKYTSLCRICAKVLEDRGAS
eukprot:CAMPEP_0182498912 /NCGR_PEP_ID=MMETSP1321-20130603/6956_1 /TAXON_ID=91990 /ORGANISM="Bolidomonas sp., Strain RCC1657" /LENGTH=430 /DNA_ID=CAMNT_0024703025 /DNA_START=104 /DNA_END=1396 /DNA_ORIENTATION=+